MIVQKQIQNELVRGELRLPLHAELLKYVFHLLALKLNLTTH